MLIPLPRPADEVEIARKPQATSTRMPMERRSDLLFYQETKHVQVKGVCPPYGRNFTGIYRYIIFDLLEKPRKNEKIIQKGQKKHLKQNQVVLQNMQ